MSSLGIDKKIAKNTLMLYFRMFLMMLISLYTGRIVLEVLGVEDYGIYNVVGGFVAMFSMISGAMVGASQRFISFELGKKENRNVHNVFCSVVTIHLILALIILVVGETVGVWAVNNYLNFSPERYAAANWIFQFSLFTFMFNIISIPYNAAIVAYEKMSAFAYISILEAVLKLLIVYLLLVSPIDKLIAYGFLMFCVAVAIRFVYTIYCSRHFSDCRYQLLLDRSLVRTMMSYTGWNFLGSWAGAFRGQGVNMVLNNFFGAAANAAQGVSHHALGSITGLVSNFNMAMNPQIIKRYAGGEKESMFKLLFSGSRLSFVMLLVVSTPIVVEAPFVLQLWLKEVPEFAIQFLRITIYVSLMDALSRNLVTAMQASGIVRNSNIAVFCVSALAIPLAYLLFTIGFPPYYAAVAQLIVSFGALWARGLILKQIIDFPFGSFLFSVVGRMWLVASLVVIPGYALSYFVEDAASDSLIIHLANMFFIFVFSLFVSYYIAFTKSERMAVIAKIREAINKKRKRR